MTTIFASQKTSSRNNWTDGRKRHQLWKKKQKDRMILPGKAAASRTATAKTASLQAAAAVREGTSRPQIQGTDRPLREVSTNILVPLKYDVIQY